MKLLVNFDQSTASLPSGFVAAVNYVVGYFDSLFTNNVTVTIDVGFGEIAGQSLASGALGEREQIIGPSVSYPSVRSGLIAQGAPGSSTLPTNSPAPSADTLLMASADEKAVGLVPDNTSLDGYVGFTSAPNTFGYGINSAPPTGEYYFVGVVEHEFTEVMGRTSDLDFSGAYSLMDLFRYAGPNVRQFSTGGPSYFSIDNGATNLNNWNNFATGNPGDLGDWAPSAGNDAVNNNSNPGVINAFTQTDITLMNALGWTSTTSPTPTPTPAPSPFSFSSPSPAPGPSVTSSPFPFPTPILTPTTPTPTSPFLILIPTPTPILTSTPTTITTTTTTLTFDNASTLGGVGDINGVGFANRIWESQNTNQAEIQLLKGATSFSDIATGTTEVPFLGGTPPLGDGIDALA